MTSLSKALRGDLRRGFISRSFLFSTALLLLWLLLNSFQLFPDARQGRALNIPQTLNISLSNVLAFSNLLPLIAALSYAWSYAMEASCGFFRDAISRVGLGAYSASKCISVALTAFLSAALAMALYLLVLFLWGFPATVDYPDTLRGTESYMTLVADGHSLLYFVVRTTILGLACGMYALIGLLASAYIHGSYIPLFLPVVVYYLSIIFADAVSLPRQFRLDCIVFFQSFDSDLASFLWAVEALLALDLLFGFLFCRRLRKEQAQ